MAISAVSTVIRAAWGALRWRWRHLGQAALSPLAWYLFPAWTVRWTWRAWALAIIILLGYGNVKYQLITLLFMLEEIDP